MSHIIQPFQPGGVVTGGATPYIIIFAPSAGGTVDIQLQINDSFSLSDSTVITLALTRIFSDNLSNWQDVLTKLPLNAFNDDLNGWVERVQVALGLPIDITGENLNNWTQAMIGQRHKSPLNWLDSISRTLVDATALQRVVSDNIGTLNDFFALGYGSAVADQITQSDSLTLLEAVFLTLSDIISFSDAESNVLGIRLALSDTNTSNWSDALTRVLGILKPLSDTNQSNWADTLLGARHAAVWRDSFNPQLGPALQLTLSVGDTFTSWPELLQLRLNDLATFSDSFTLTDAMSGARHTAQWYDAITASLTVAPTEVIKSDDLNNWNDAIRMGYGFIFTQALVLVDSGELTLNGTTSGWTDAIALNLIVTSLVVIDDGGNNWQDGISLLLIGTDLQLNLSDSFTLTDSILAPIGLIIVTIDGGNNWQDSFASQSSDYTLSLFDSISWQDAIQLIFGLIEQPSDDLNNWLDSIASFPMPTFSEQLEFGDSLGIGFGYGLSDSFLEMLDNIDTGGFPVNLLLTLTDAFDIIVSEDSIDLKRRNARPHPIRRSALPTRRG